MEDIVLLDDHYKPIGTAPKMASHHAHTPLHLAFSCYLFNDKGEMLVTQRALSKKVWPSVWTNSFCGHPLPNEPIEQAIHRRAKDELGITDLTDITELLPDFRYTTPPYNGIVENEFCPVFGARIASDVQHNPEEVSAYHWQLWSEVLRAVAANPDNYSYWMKLQLALLQKHPRISCFTHAL